MRDVFINYGALMAAAWFAKKKQQKPPENKNQVLKSRRIEDEIYRQTRGSNSVLDKIRSDCAPKLPVVENLSKDVFQSLYSLDVRHNEQSELSPLVRRFNRHLLNEVMKSPDYPAMKSICEGRGYPAMEAASEFMEQVSENLDDLLAAANGENNALDALEKCRCQAADSTYDKSPSYRFFSFRLKGLLYCGKIAVTAILRLCPHSRSSGMTILPQTLCVHGKIAVAAILRLKNRAIPAVTAPSGKIAAVK